MENKSKAYKLAMCALFTTLIIVGAFLKIPMPIVPKTLQFFFVVLAAICLGGKWSSISVLVYICLGLVGVPVFTSGGGIGYVLMPTFGYMIGFVIGAFIQGTMLEKGGVYTFKRMLLTSYLNMAIVYFIGVVYCYLISNFVLGNAMTFWPLMVNGFFMLAPGDMVLLILAAYLGKRLVPVIRRG